MTPTASDPPPRAEGSFARILKGLGRTASLYLMGVFAIRFAEFLLIPIYWRYLKPADYGVVAASGIISTFLAASLGLGLHESVTRFYHEWQEGERRTRIGAIWVLSWGSSFTIGLLLAMFGGPLLSRLIEQVPFDPYLRLGVLIGTASTLSLLPLTILRASERAGQYLMYSVLSLVLNASGALIAVAVLQRGVVGLLWAQLLAHGVMAIAYSIMMMRHARPSLCTQYLNEALSYSLPLVPSAMIDAGSNLIDRFILEKKVGLHDLGIYAMATTLCAPLRLLNTGLKTAWVPFQMRIAAQHPNAARVMSRTATFFAYAVFIATVGWAVAIGDVIHLFGESAYFPVAKYVPLALIPYAVNALSVFFVGGLLVARKTNYMWTSGLIFVVVSIVANLALIPRFGLYGAIFATLLAFLARATWLSVLSQKWYRIPFEWPKLTLGLAGAIGTYVAAAVLPLGYGVTALAVRLALVGVFAAVAIYVLVEGKLERLKHLRALGSE